MSDESGAQKMKINLKEHPELMQTLSEAGFNIDLEKYSELFIAEPRIFSYPTTNVSPESKEVLSKLRQFALQVIDENKMSLRNSSHSIRRSYWTLYLMYCTMFTVGITTAIVAIIKGFTASSATDTYSTLIFAGLSAGSFFTLFITRPLESLERNSIFSSWLIAITNTYWTEYAYFDDPGKAYDDLKKATDDLTKELSDLADKHATAIGKYPALTTPDAKTSPPKSSS